MKKIDAEVRGIVNEAAEFATNDAEPDPSELWTDVYAGKRTAAWLSSHSSWLFWRSPARSRAGSPAPGSMRRRCGNLSSERGQPRLAWLAVVAWPFATGRIKGAAAARAAQVNKALVAFLACLMVAAGGDLGGDQPRAGLPLDRQRVMRPCRSKC